MIGMSMVTSSEDVLGFAWVELSRRSVSSDWSGMARQLRIQKVLSIYLISSFYSVS